MAMLKVNSIIAESSYIAVINKVAGVAIRTLTLLPAKIRAMFQFKKKKKRPQKYDRRK